MPLRLLPLPIRCLPSLLQNSDNKAIYESSPKGVQTCLGRETLRISPHKGCSQVLKRCQIPNVVWDGAHQIVASQISAPKYMYTGWVKCQMQYSQHEECIAFCSLIFLSSPLHLLGNNRSKQSFQSS